MSVRACECTKFLRIMPPVICSIPVQPHCLTISLFHSGASPVVKFGLHRRHGEIHLRIDIGRDAVRQNIDGPDESASAFAFFEDGSSPLRPC